MMVVYFLMAFSAMASGEAAPAPGGRCPEASQAVATASRLAELPLEIRSDLVQLTENTLADSDVVLLQGDAPHPSSLGLPSARFVQAMLFRDKWVVQFEVALFAGVRTVTYIRNNFTGPYQRSPAQYFGGPACASLRAVLDGVATPGGF